MPFTSNRRDFMKAAALSSAAALASTRLIAQAAPASGDAPAAPTPAGPVPAVGPGADPNVPLAPPDKQPPKLEVPTPVQRKVGWAAVGLGELALEEILPAFREAKLSVPVALVSGHPEKGQQVAAAYGLKPESVYSYENFDKIAADPAIEVVYIVLPNSLHAEYTERALRAGKHVLCEKPMADKIEAAESMIATAAKSGRKLMIAYRMHYEPKTQTAKGLIQSRAYGAPKTFFSCNCQNVEAPNIRLSKTLGGGPLGDIGVYSVNTARFLLGEDPIEVSAQAFQSAEDPRFREVPESVTFTLRFPSGVLASCICSFGTSEHRQWTMHCEKGVLTMDPAFSYEGLRLYASDGQSKKGTANKSEFLVPDKNQFAQEMDHFSQCVLDGTEPRTPGQEGLTDMRILAALEEAYKTGKVVKVSR